MQASATNMEYKDYAHNDVSRPPESGHAVAENVKVEKAPEPSPMQSRDIKLPVSEAMKRMYDPDTNEILDKAIELANKHLSQTNNEILRSVHKKTNTIVIKVIDKETKETVREFPPEKRLDAIAKLWELVGILVDEAR